MNKIYQVVHSIMFWFLVFLYAAIINKISFFVSLFIRDKNKKILFYHKGAVLWGTLIMKASLVKVQVEGLENVPKNTNVIFTSNHQSYLDIFILLKYLPLPFRFVIMRKLFNIPFIGDHITRAGYISLDTKDRKKSFEIIDNIVGLLKNNNSFVIFPEGRLTDDGSIREFSRGASIIIQKSSIAIVPIAINGSFFVLPKGRWKLNTKSIVKVKIGKPVVFDCYKQVTKETSAKVSEELKEIVEDLKRN